MLVLVPSAPSSISSRSGPCSVSFTRARFCSDGWFIESMVTRPWWFFASARGDFSFAANPADSHRHEFGAIAVAIVLPFLPWGVGAWFGFAAPPPLFFLFLATATIAYLALVEISKAIFYRALSGRNPTRAIGFLIERKRLVFRCK